MNKSISKQYITLHGKYDIPLSLSNSVRNQVLKVIGKLPHGYCFTLKQLCGDAYWLGLKTSGNRTKAGLAMAEMVRTGIIPLKFAKKIGATWMYALPDVAH